MFLLINFLTGGIIISGRSLDNDNTINNYLLWLFNDVYEDGRLDDPFLVAKVLSQVFPDEYDPPGQRNTILTQQLALMLPEQLGHLSSAKELSVPSVLVHLWPEKFAQLDFAHLDRYSVKSRRRYANPRNARMLLLRWMSLLHQAYSAVRETVPHLLERSFTPEMEQEIHSMLNLDILADILPAHLDVGRLFDLLGNVIHQEAATEGSESDVDDTSSHPAESSSSEQSRCFWGPVVCSLSNRMPIQRNFNSLKQTINRKSGLKLMPAWFRLTRTTPDRATLEQEKTSVEAQPKQPNVFHRIRTNVKAVKTPFRP